MKPCFQIADESPLHVSLISTRHDRQSTTWHFRLMRKPLNLVALSRAEKVKVTSASICTPLMRGMLCQAGESSIDTVKDSCSSGLLSSIPPKLCCEAQHLCSTVHVLQTSALMVLRTEQRMQEPWGQVCLTTETDPNGCLPSRVRCLKDELDEWQLPACSDLTLPTSSMPMHCIHSST